MFLLAAFAFSPVEAIEQWRNRSHDESRDTTLISEWVDGNYLVRRYVVRHNDDEAPYTLRYTVAASRLSDLTANNAAELADVDQMMEKLRRDTSLHVRSIEITGYASPDGNPVSNEALAMSRAQKFRSLLDSRYGLVSNYVVRVRSDAEHWDACDAAVRNSSIADKQRVLTILDSSASESAKEQQLKQMPTVWNLFRSQILPPMRRVEMVVYYDEDDYYEVRTLIDKPKPTPKPREVRREVVEPTFTDDMSIGIIVDMSDRNRIY